MCAVGNRAESRRDHCDRHSSFIYEIFFTRGLQPPEFKGAIELNSGENFTCHPDCPLIPLAGPQEGTSTRVTRLFDSALCAIPEAVLDSVGKEDWEPSERKKRNEDREGTPRVNKGGNGVNKKQPPRKSGSRRTGCLCVGACIYTCAQHTRARARFVRETCRYIRAVPRTVDLSS